MLVESEHLLTTLQVPDLHCAVWGREGDRGRGEGEEEEEEEEEEKEEEEEEKEEEEEEEDDDLTEPGQKAVRDYTIQWERRQGGACHCCSPHPAIH